MLYQIHWKSLKTGFTGHGTGKFPKEEAERYAEHLNKQDELIELIHWIEPVEGEKETTEG